MVTYLRQLLRSRLWALIRKEIQQILRNRQIIVLLLFPPTVQLLVFGIALNPEVTGLSLGVVDYSRSAQSRALVSALVENRMFQVQAYEPRQADLGEQVRRGRVTAGLVIPPDFSATLQRQETATVQVLIDGVDANTAGIAQGYIKQIVQRYSQSLALLPVGQPSRPWVYPEVQVLYNPGLRSSWFFVPGVIGVVLTLTGSLVSSTTVIREKDVGTLEQLLMTPAAAWEILAAKIVPLFGLLLGDVLLASALGWLVFDLPFRGNYLLFLGFSALYLMVCIGIGILLATLAQNQQQVVLISFFFNVPLIQLSGAIAPIESMPPVFQALSFLNPLRHYVHISRSLILKDVGLDALWMQGLALAIVAVLMLGVSIHRFRAQLS
jgi:ABC-2 type transport system permease protein